MKYNRITYDQRKVIEKRLKLGVPITKIAQELGHKYMTVWKEIHRVTPYSADASQKLK